VDGRQEGRPDESRPGKRQEVEVVVEEVETIRLLHGPGDVERLVHLGGDLRSTLGLELRLSRGLVRPTPHRRSSSSPVEGGKQDPIDNPDWPIVVLSDHDPPVSDAVGCTDPKDLALEPDRLLPGHYFRPVSSDPASAPEQLPEWGRLKGCTGCEQSGGGIRIAALPRISERHQPDAHGLDVHAIRGRRRRTPDH
jgi:hypothetical protein